MHIRANDSQKSKTKNDKASSSPRDSKERGISCPYVSGKLMHHYQKIYSQLPPYLVLIALIATLGSNRTVIWQ